MLISTVSPGIVPRRPGLPSVLVSCRFLGFLFLQGSGLPRLRVSLALHGIVRSHCGLLRPTVGIGFQPVVRVAAHARQFGLKLPAVASQKFPSWA